MLFSVPVGTVVTSKMILRHKYVLSYHFNASISCVRYAVRLVSIAFGAKRISGKHLFYWVYLFILLGPQKDPCIRYQAC